MILGMSTKFTLLNDKPPSGCVWSQRRLTKIQATSRPGNAWPESWSGMSKTARKEKQERAIEEPKIDNARRARGI